MINFYKPLVLPKIEALPAQLNLIDRYIGTVSMFETATVIPCLGQE